MRAPRRSGAEATENQTDQETTSEESAGSLGIEALRKGKGEYGETIGDYHYFVTQL